MPEYKGRWGAYCNNSKQHFYAYKNSIGCWLNRQPPYTSICGAQVGRLGSVIEPVSRIAGKCKHCEKMLKGE